MKTFFYTLLVIVFSINVTNAQRENSLDYLNKLPNDLKLDNSVIRSYEMITDYYNYDLKRNFLEKKRIKGIITYGLNEDSVQWQDVYSSDSRTFDEEFLQGQKIEFLQNFKYKSDDKVLNTEFFKDNLPEADPSVMNLIWDLLCFEVLAYNCWDSLELNKEFAAKNMNSEMEIADIGTFENSNIIITWIGITKINNEICAILKYSVMNNPLNLELEYVSMSGRSHYWGEIYVSLSTKHIEYANLTEDVLTDMKFKGQTNNISGYTIRTIQFSKVE